MASICIVMATCDRPEMRRRAIASVLRQTDPDWSLIVIDDGTPGPDIAPTLPDDARVSFIRTAGRIGAASARNLGLARATADWIVIFDDDDEMQADYVANLRTVAELARPGPVLALGNWLILDYGEAGLTERRRHYDIDASARELNIHQALRAGACGLAVNRTALALAGLMDASYAVTEDTEWILRLIEAGSEIRVVPGDGFVIHNHRAGDRLTDRSRLEKRIMECRRMKARYGDLKGRAPGLEALLEGLAEGFAIRLEAERAAG